MYNRFGNKYINKARNNFYYRKKLFFFLHRKIDTQVLQLISHTSTLTEQSKLAVGGTDSAKMDVNLLAEAWTSLVIDIGSALKEMIGCWGQPGNSLMEASLGGATESLPREVGCCRVFFQNILQDVMFASVLDSFNNLCLPLHQCVINS